MVEWSYYDRFKDITAKYLPSYGEGENMAEQIVTAVNKLVYKWYNDGDVYDNPRYMTGWCNDLSSYANWLAEYTDQKPLLYGIFQCMDEDDYENLLQNLADNLLDAEKLAEYEKKPKAGSIYDCAGPFVFEEPEEEEEWDEELSEDW